MPPAQYGYVPGYKPPKTPKINTGGLAAAAAPTSTNPFGLNLPQHVSGSYAYTPPTHPAAAAPGTAQPAAAAPKTVVPATAAAPPTPAGYDLNTDPALQQISALTGLSDEQANAAALKQKQHLALGYGSDTFAHALGLDDSYAEAASHNPTSALAQAAQQRDRNTKSLTDQLFANNLGYSGYRVTQEEQAAQDYQNELADLAGQYDTGADTISGNLSSTLGQNQAQRTQALNDAATRAIQAAIANGGAGGTDGVPSMDGVPLTVQGPGPMRPPDNPIEAAHPYGTQTQTMSDFAASGSAPMQPLYGGSFDAPFLSPLAAAASPGYGSKAKRLTRLGL